MKVNMAPLSAVGSVTIAFVDFEIDKKGYTCFSI